MRRRECITALALALLAAGAIAGQAEHREALGRARAFQMTPAEAKAHEKAWKAKHQGKLPEETLVPVEKMRPKLAGKTFAEVVKVLGKPSKVERTGAFVYQYPPVYHTVAGKARVLYGWRVFFYPDPAKEDRKIGAPPAPVVYRTHADPARIP